MAQKIHSGAFRESKIQQQIIIWFRNNYCLKHHDPRCAIFSVPNEMQMKFFNTGLMPGVSDLIVLIPDKVLFVECKTENGKQSEKQKEFQKIVEGLNFKYYLVRSLEEFIRCLNFDK